MASNNNSQSPLSHLGNTGRSLLKFIQPVFKIEPHTKESIPHLEKDAATAKSRLAFEKTTTPAVIVTQPEGAVIKAATIKKEETTQARSTSTAIGTPGSGVIRLEGDSRTPWIQVVVDLSENCDKNSPQARGYKALNAYQSSAQNKSSKKRRPQGSIVNLLTLEESEIEDQQRKAELAKQNEETERRRTNLERLNTLKKAA